MSWTLSEGGFLFLYFLNLSLSGGQFALLFFQSGGGWRGRGWRKGMGSGARREDAEGSEAPVREFVAVPSDSLSAGDNFPTVFFLWEGVGG